MRGPTRTALAIVLLVLCAPALAQVDDGQVSVSFFALYVDPGTDLGVDSSVGVGAAVGWAVTPNITLEGLVYRSAGHDFELVDQDTTLRQARLGALFLFNRPNERVEPYLALGLAWLDPTRGAELDEAELKRQADLAGRSTLRYDESAAGYSAGYGVSWGLGTHIFLSDRVSLRLDARWFSAISQSDVRFSNFEPFIGLSFWSGGS